ncbi:EcsC family protein [Intrasporangium calvum]|uniref:EcsC family protein n=1 Tax=Intrasporangium calvum TaxID=53358 RepID=A0ABT5GEA2_9MICO|nr:EcsC family protein [Intrasporangium calvum]MDC5696544.1 EcsC family protein [Intrasporangium calvum]
MKAGDRLQKLVMTAVTDGVGPVTGSVAYAISRLPKTATTHSFASGDSGAPPTIFSGAGGPDAEAAIRRIIRESQLTAGSNGFLTGLGGFITMPVSIPANVAGNLVINARMVGAIAYLRGYSLEDPFVRSMLPLVVAGSSAQSAAAALGLKVGEQLSRRAIAKVSVETIRSINKKVGFYLVAKYGTQRAAFTLTKVVPGVSALVGGAIDATLTTSIGKVAKRVFPIS